MMKITFEVGNVDLLQEGINQIKKTRKYIEDNLKFEYILTSDIKRALNTSNIINNNLNKKIIINIDLRELNKGNLNGKLKNDLSESDLYMNKEKFNVIHGSVHECDLEKKYIRRIY